MFSHLKLFPQHQSRNYSYTIMMDSNVLMHLCQDTPIISLPKVTEVKLNLIKNNAVFLFTIPSLFEFKVKSKIEKIFLENLNKASVANLNLTPSQYIECCGNENLDKNKGYTFGILPDTACWEIAKHSLQILDSARKTTKGNNKEYAKEYLVDALICAVALNTQSFVWTDNIKDFLLIYYYFFLRQVTKDGIIKKDQDKLIARNIPPVFTTDMLLENFKGEEYNIYERMNQYKNCDEVKKILKIAAALLDK